jgi:hypothetical protein
LTNIGLNIHSDMLCDIGRKSLQKMTLAATGRLSFRQNVSFYQSRRASKSVGNGAATSASRVKEKLSRPARSGAFKLA